jgi:hypothetical protein
MPKEKEPKKRAATSKDAAPQAAQTAVPNERKNFRRLILSNPNFFGTSPQLGKAVKAISSNSDFEQLTCLGLNPGGAFGAGRLEAVINIKQHSGYGTDACGAGTTEYVRFFVQDSTGWHDLGLSSVQVFDLAGPLPLSYAVSVDFDRARLRCSTENILSVRAILSWSLEPTAGDPNFIPVWGNVLDARVQVAPRPVFTIPLGELIAQKAITIDPSIIKDVNLNQTLPTIEAKPLNFGELKRLYADAKVPAHRFGFSEAMKLASGPLGKALSAVAPPPPTAKGEAEAKPAAFTNLLTTIDLGAILTALEGISGDRTFEELTCAGYNPQTRMLEGIIQMKQSSGFSGGLCTPGSTEYVSFFAFFGGAWQDLGTAEVQVHDLSAVAPTRPISYAVFRVSNLTSMPCHDLTGIPLRAILSWQVRPTGPNFIPTWGNVLNTNVQPQIAAGTSEALRLMRIGRVSVSGISDTSGLANPTGVAGDCSGNDSPFGGSIIAEGDFIPKIDVFNHLTGVVLAGAKPIIYQAWVTPSAGPPFQLTNSFGIELYPPDATAGVFKTQTATPAPGPVLGGAAGALYYTYMESDLQAVNPRTLAVFEAGGLSQGLYTLEIRGFKWNGVNYLPVPVQSQLIYVYNGYPHTELTVGGGTISVQRPQVSITLLPPFADCGDAQVGDPITGTFSVTDDFFGSVSLRLVPITIGGVPQPSPPVILSTGGSSVSYDGSNTTGVSGTFTLNTTGMTPCGYTILLQASDRALVSSSCSGHYNERGVGFCLRKK